MKVETEEEETEFGPDKAEKEKYNKVKQVKRGSFGGKAAGEGQ